LYNVIRNQETKGETMFIPNSRHLDKALPNERCAECGKEFKPGETVIVTWSSWTGNRLWATCRSSWICERNL